MPTWRAVRRCVLELEKLEIELAERRARTEVRSGPQRAGARAPRNAPACAQCYDRLREAAYYRMLLDAAKLDYVPFEHSDDFR